MPKRLPPPPECANCGADIPPDAKACPECGADERTGWREASIYDGLDLPDEAYGEKSASRPEGRRFNWTWLVAILLLALLVYTLVLGR